MWPGPVCEKSSAHQLYRLRRSKQNIKFVGLLFLFGETAPRNVQRGLSLVIFTWFVNPGAEVHVPERIIAHRNIEWFRTPPPGGISLLSILKLGRCINGNGRCGIPLRGIQLAWVCVGLNADAAGYRKSLCIVDVHYAHFCPRCQV